MHNNSDARINLIDKLQIALISIYVPISGIFWFGQINPSFISYLKLILFFTLVLISAFRQFPVVRNSNYIFVLLAVCSILAFLANLITGGMSSAFAAALYYAEPALWLVALFGLKPVAHKAVFKYLKVGCFAFFIISLYPLLIYFGVVQNMFPPPGYIDYAGDIESQNAFSEAVSAGSAGFTGSRTGWGVVVSGLTLLLISLLTNKAKVTLINLYFCLLILALSILTIAATGARTGVIALCLGGIWFFYKDVSLRTIQKILIAFILFVFLIILSPLVPDLLSSSRFFRGFESGGSFFEKLNAISSGRFDTYIESVNKVLDSPIVGHGYDESLISMPSGALVLPHNVWLRTLIESGLFVFFSVFLVTVFVAQLAFRNSLNKLKKISPYPSVSAVIFCGFVLAFFEPSVIFGSMNTNIPFWTAVWILMSKAIERRRLIENG